MAINTNPTPVPAPAPGPVPRPTASAPVPVTPGVATGTIVPSPTPIRVDPAAEPVPLGPGTGISPAPSTTVSVASIDITPAAVTPTGNISSNVVVATVKPGGNIGAIQFNNGNTFGGNANLVFAQGGLFVGGVPTSLNASGIITARNEYRFGVWSGFDGPSNDAWGRVRLGSFNSSQTFYGFNGDPAITNPNRTVVITNEEQDVHQAMVLMDGLAYNAPSGEGTIFGISVNQTNADYRASTGFELGWKKIIEATNKGNFKIGGNLVISPSFQTSPPANTQVGIKFADGTFQYTAATGGSGANIAVFDETTLVTANVSTFVFQGSGVSVGQVGNETYVEIAGGSGISGITVQEEGSNVVASANTINFVGTGVTATNVGNVATVTIPASSLVNTVYNAGFANTVTLNYNNGQWQNYSPDDAVLNVTISNIPTGGEMTVFLRYGSDNTAISWSGPTAIYWENGDDTPSQTLGQRDVLTVKNNGNYYFASLGKNYV